MRERFGSGRKRYVFSCWCVSALVLLTAASTYWRGLSVLRIPRVSGECPKSGVSFDGFPERTWSIKHGTLLYLVMGDGHPPQRWLDRSRWKDISVIYTAWKIDIREKLRNITGHNLRVTYYPKSTWTTGRNHQLQQAKLWEEEQKWQFETLIFFDADVWLTRRVGDSKDTIVRVPRNLSDDEGLEILNKNLRRDKPLRATIMFNHISEHATCISNCAVDHAVMAFHRTGVELTIPYIDILDSESWWYSAAIHNYLAGAVYPTYCMEYQDIGIDGKAQVHGSYPQGGPLKYRWISPALLVGACLTSAGFPGFHTSMLLEDIRKKVSAPRGTCKAPAPADIDYYAIARKQRWLRYLRCLQWGPQRDVDPSSS